MVNVDDERTQKAATPEGAATTRAGGKHPRAGGTYSVSR
jgi:hypothetical protein